LASGWFVALRPELTVVGGVASFDPNELFKTEV
jgi:hypothetical protein